MEQHNDEVIAKMLVELDRIRKDLMKLDSQLDLGIKRMVKTEIRLEMKEEGVNTKNWRAGFNARVAKREAEFEASTVRANDEFDTRMKVSMKFLLEQFKKNDRLAEGRENF